MTGTRVRLATQARREQLLRIGAGLFAARPYDEVWIEEVAELAAVSRGLLYHYFATKREFFAAVVEAEAERILAHTRTDPEQSIPEQIRVGLETYFDYLESHENGVRVLHRASIAADEGIRAIVERNLTEQQRRILARLNVKPDQAELVRLAVRGWLLFVITVCLDWLDNRTVSRDTLRDLCAAALIAILDGKLAD
ncbi:MAG TPA: TetR/AcrR family transcriptional regulator [Rugosimonospora sp.]|nr:TetR/AcrR family transcriptional regulator [Rugosimonospora sp.]